MKNTPNYRKIYQDMIDKKYPEKKNMCNSILQKKRIGIIDVIKLNDLIVGFDKGKQESNQKLKSYDCESIFEILKYQKMFNLNNTQTAAHFNLSRNTLAGWKKRFPVELVKKHQKV